MAVSTSSFLYFQGLFVRLLGHDEWKLGDDDAKQYNHRETLYLYSGAMVFVFRKLFSQSVQLCSQVDNISQTTFEGIGHAHMGTTIHENALRSFSGIRGAFSGEVATIAVPIHPVQDHCPPALTLRGSCVTIAPGLEMPREFCRR